MIKLSLNTEKFDIYRKNALLIALSIFSLAIMSLYFKSHSIWLDEGASVAFASASFGDLLDVILKGEANMSLYYLSLHFWMKIGSSEVFLRLLTTIVGILTILIFYKVSVTLFDRKTANYAVILLSSNHFFLHHAFEIRGYTLFAMTTLLATLAYLHSREGTLRSLLVFVLCSCIATYAHSFGLFFFVSILAFSLIFRKYSNWSIKKSILAFFLYITACIPLLVISSGTHSWVQTPFIEDIYRLFSILLGGKYSVLIFGLTFTYFLIRYYKSYFIDKKQSYVSSSPLFLCFFFIITPITLVFIISQFKSAFLPRYFIFILPFLLLSLAVAIKKIPSGATRSAIISGIVLFNLIPLFMEQDHLTDDWKSASSLVLSKYKEGDGLIFLPKWCAYSFAFYSDQSGVDPKFIPGPVEPQLIFSSLESIESDVMEAGPKLQRIWFLTRNFYGSKGAKVRSNVLHNLENSNLSFSLVEKYHFKSITIELFEKKSSISMVN